jgi:hypothetical protein
MPDEKTPSSGAFLPSSLMHFLSGKPMHFYSGVDSAPHPSAEGTSTPMTHALPSAHCEPLRHPKAPGLSLAGFRLVIADHALGFPVFRALSLCTCRRHYPGAASGRIASLISSRRISLPRKGCRVGLRIVLFEDCSAFTRVAACTLALSPIRDTLIEGFSHFVTSMTAPIASGWSGCRVGLAPTGKRRLFTAHTRSRQSVFPALIRLMPNFRWSVSTNLRSQGLGKLCGV